MTVLILNCGLYSLLIIYVGSETGPRSEISCKDGSEKNNVGSTTLVHYTNKKIHHVLVKVSRWHGQQHPPSGDFRYIAYRNIFTIYSRTKRKMSRMPLPSCLVLRLRAAYPDPNAKYTGFRGKKSRR